MTSCDGHVCKMAEGNAVGRPPIDIDLDEVEYLRSSLLLKWPKIAELFGTTRQTIYRKLKEDGISVDFYSSVTDAQLDTQLRCIIRLHPNDGEVLLPGHLRSQGINVARSRIRAAIHRVDPEGPQLRSLTTVRRRIYSSEGANHVWHIDGNHKLIRWRMVIHGGIDGFSRLIVYMRCATNNRASTVHSQFEAATNTYGHPHSIRSDLGGENVDVWRHMLQVRDDPSCVITGSSTHNERIERLWNDTNRCITRVYSDMFRQLESEEVLDPLNEIDMFCLHFVFVPRINKNINEFVQSWNNHPLSTKRNMTPNQLFVTYFTATEMRESTSTLSGNGPLQNELPPVQDTVSVPCPVLSLLLSTVDPLGQSNNFGIDIFHQVLRIASDHLQQVCAVCHAN